MVVSVDLVIVVVLELRVLSRMVDRSWDELGDDTIVPPAAFENKEGR